MEINEIEIKINNKIPRVINKLQYKSPRILAICLNHAVEGGINGPTEGNDGFES